MHASANLFPEELIQAIHDNLHPETKEEEEKVLSTVRCLYRLKIGPYSQDNFDVHNLEFRSPLMKVLQRRSPKEGPTQGDDIFGILSYLQQVPVAVLDVVSPDNAEQPADFFQCLTLYFPETDENPLEFYHQHAEDLEQLRTRFELSHYEIPRNLDTDRAIQKDILMNSTYLGDGEGWTSDQYYLSNWVYSWEHGDLLFLVRHHETKSLLWICYNAKGDGYFQVHSGQ